MDGLLDRSTPPPPGEPRPYELPTPTELELGNGLSVVLVDRPGTPTVAARLSIRAGHDATDGHPELAELTARVLRDGAANDDSAALASRISGSGLDYRASVGENRVVLAVDGLTPSMTEMLSLLRDLASAATLDPDRVAARRAEYASELTLAASEPSYHLGRMRARVLFGDHIYGASPTADDVAALTAEQVAEFYASTYGPTRARLVLVGELPDDAEEIVRNELSGWTADVEPWTAPSPPTVWTCNEAHVVVRPGSDQTAISWVGPGTDKSQDDWFAALVANQVLGGGPSARLFMNLREEKSYTYGAYSNLASAVGAAWFSASSNVRSDVTEPALVAFEEEFDEIRHQPIPDEELVASRTYLSGVFPIQLERNSSLAGTISALLDDGIPLAYLESYRDEVQTVAADDIAEAAATYVAPAHFALVMVGEREAAVPAAQAHASTVFVYDLDGELIETLEGQRPSTCQQPVR